MDKQGKPLSLTFLGNQAKNTESYCLEHESCSQTIRLANRLDVPEQNSPVIHVQLGSPFDKMRDKFPSEWHHLGEENPTALPA